MAYELKNVVPWGRSFNEYISMFSLTQNDLKKNILGCGDGPASFNSTMKKLGNRCISIDPIYQFTKHEIQSRIDDCFNEVIEQTRKNKHEFLWKSIGSVDELAKIRQKAMNRFIADYELGIKEERYSFGELPKLNFKANQFDIALCSHFLFLYSKQFSLKFHIESIIELCRVAQEVRIFPLLELGAIDSRHLDEVCKKLTELNFKILIKKVPYEFQKGGNKLLIINK